MSFVQKISLKRGSQQAAAGGYQGQGDPSGLRLDLDISYCLSAWQVFIDTVSNLFIFPLHYKQRVSIILSLLNLSVPNCCTAMSGCFI